MAKQRQSAKADSAKKNTDQAAITDQVVESGASSDAPVTQSDEPVEETKASNKAKAKEAPKLSDMEHDEQQKFMRDYVSKNYTVPERSRKVFLSETLTVWFESSEDAARDYCHRHKLKLYTLEWA